MDNKHLQHTWSFFALASLGIIGGGLLSAVTAHSPTQSASWASAYLVLVVGVASGGLGYGRLMLAAQPATPLRIWVEFLTWAVGNAGVLVGTLTAPAGWVEVGSALMVYSLVSVVLGIRGGPARGVIRWLFITLVTVVAVSIPVGVLLSHLRR